MALIECTECGHEFSPGVSACPQCGHPTAAVAEKPIVQHPGGSENSGDATADPVAPPEEDGWSRIPTWVLFVVAFVGGSAILIAGVFAIVVLIGSALGESEDPAVVGDTTTTVTAVPDGDENGLLVGQCINEDELDKYLNGDDFSLVPCDEPHDSEAYYAHEFEEGPYPGDETVIDDLRSVCRGAFEGYVGRDYESSSLNFWSLWPTQGFWESGNRTGECVLFDSDSNQLTGSAKGSSW